MKRFAIIICATVLAAACTSPRIDIASIANADTRIDRVEPLSWWVGMETPLQLLVCGANISEYDVIAAGDGSVEVTGVHKADSPDYLFVDVKVSPRAEAGTYFLVFSRGEERFKFAYEIAARREGSRERESFTTADMIYLLMPDRFANGNPDNDTVEGLEDGLDRDNFFGRHGGDIAGIAAHLDYIADLGATAVWSTPLLFDNEKGGSYHGYACDDYYRIDPRYGTNDEYRRMVAEAHSKGLKVIMDVVPNHCGTHHWWFENSPFGDWIHRFDEYTPSNIAFSTNMDPNASQRDLMLQESGWFVPSMPDMNLDNPFLLQLLQAVGCVVDRVCRSRRSARRYLPVQREDADERVVCGRSPRISEHEYRRRVLDVVDSATRLLAGRQRQQGRIRLASAVDNGFPAARGCVQGDERG